MKFFGNVFGSDEQNQIDIICNAKRSFEDKVAVLERTKYPAVIAAAAEQPETELRQLAASHNLASEQVLADLSGDNDPNVRWQVACNENTNGRTLESLYMEDPNKEIRLAALENINATEYILCQALSGSDPKAQVIAAGHDGATDRVLRRAMVSPDPLVRAACAENENTYDDILSVLIEDKHLLVRENVCLNDHASVKTIAKALKDPVDLIRGYACMSTACTMEMLNAMRGDGGANVQKGILWRDTKARQGINLESIKDPGDFIPLYLGDTKLTWAQRTRLAEGRTIRFENLLAKDGSRKDYDVHSDGTRLFADEVK